MPTQPPSDPKPRGRPKTRTAEELKAAERLKKANQRARAKAANPVPAVEAATEEPIPWPGEVASIAPNTQAAAAEQFGVVPELAILIAAVADFDPVKAGLRPWGERPSNIPERDLSKTPLQPGWRRLSWRVINATIPSPIPYHAPLWAGPDAIVTASGRCYHYATGQEIRRYEPSGVKFKPNDGSSARLLRGSR